VGEGLRPGGSIGTLAVDFAKRHRSRVNGVVRSADGGVILVDVDQAYANCPKYIQRREEPEEAVEPSTTAPDDPPPSRTAALDVGQIDLIRRADTFFIGTAAPGHGADASHRGGAPRFVRATAGSVEWPDYAGNSMFNTLGNVEASRRAGLAFIDFATGTVVQLTGPAEIVWDAESTEQVPGAERLVRVQVEEVVETRRRLLTPLPVVEYSPFNPPVALDGRRANTDTSAPPAKSRRL